MNSKIIRNFDDFLNEEEEFDLYEENDLDLYDELDEELDSEYEDLDESYEDDFYSEEDYDFEDELDESEYYDELSEKKGLADVAKNVAKKVSKSAGGSKLKDPSQPAKFKYRANMAPRFIMASLKGTGAIKAAGAAATPSNLGYKKGAKSMDLLPATAMDFLRMSAQMNPGKIDPVSYKKVMKNLMDLHASKVGNMPAAKKPKPGKLDPKFRQTWIDAKKAKKSTFMFNGKKFATANGKAVK